MRQFHYIWYDVKPQLRPYKNVIYTVSAGTGLLLLAGIGWQVRRRWRQ